MLMHFDENERGMRKRQHQRESTVACIYFVLQLVCSKAKTQPWKREKATFDSYFCVCIVLRCPILKWSINLGPSAASFRSEVSDRLLPRVHCTKANLGGCLDCSELLALDRVSTEKWIWASPFLFQRTRKRWRGVHWKGTNVRKVNFEVCTESEAGEGWIGRFRVLAWLAPFKAGDSKVLYLISSLLM